MSVPAPLPLLEKNIYFDIPLHLEAIPTLYGIIDVMPEVDFILSEPYNLLYPTIMSSDLLRSCFYYNSENGIINGYITENPDILAALAASVNQIIYCDLFNLVYSRYSDNENNPAMYNNAIIGGVPEQSGFGLQYIQYLATSFFTNPQSSAPIANIHEVIRHMMRGVTVSVTTPAIIDVNDSNPLTNVITPAITTQVLQTLGQQFVSFIQSKTELDGTNPFVHHLFEQILSPFPERFNLTDNSLEGVFISLPFEETDRINFDIVVNGTLSLHLKATTANPCTQVNYAPPSLMRMFPKASTNPSWADIVNYDTSSRSSLTLIPKTFRANLCLSGDQDISKIHSLYATKILLANANRNLSLSYTTQGAPQTIATKDIYPVGSLTSDQSRDRRRVMMSIFGIVMSIANKLTEVKGNNVFTTGSIDTSDLLRIFIDLLQELIKIIDAFGELSQYDFDLPDTIYYSNATGVGAVNTCQRITSADFAAGNTVLNMSLINESIAIAMKSLALVIGNAFNNDLTNLPIDNRIRNSLLEAFPGVISTVNVIKILCNLLATYLNIDFQILKNVYSVYDDIALITSQKFTGYGDSLLNLMPLIDVNIMALYMITNRPIATTVSSVFEHIKHPNMTQIAALATTVVDTLAQVDVVAKTSTFIKDLCISLSSMTSLMIACLSPSVFDLEGYKKSFNDPYDQTLLTTIFNYGGVIDPSNKLVFTKMVGSGGVVTYLEDTSYDLINNQIMTTDLTRIGQPAIFADTAAALAAKNLIAASPTIPQINGANASTGLNNGAGYLKSKSIMGGVNNGPYVRANIAYIAAQASAASAQAALNAAQTVLTAAIALDAATRVAADLALVLADSTALTTHQLLLEVQRLIEILAPAAQQAKAQTDYTAAKAVSDPANAALIAANATNEIARVDLLKAQSKFDAILSNNQARQAALFSAYETELLCKSNKIKAQNAFVKASAQDVISKWIALDIALKATPQIAVDVDAATIALNTSLLAGRGQVNIAIIADNAQLVKDANNAVELVKDNAQLALDQSTLNAIDALIADMTATPLVAVQASVDSLSAAKSLYI
jgi:hypothetical protein